MFLQPPRPKILSFLLNKIEKLGSRQPFGINRFVAWEQIMGTPAMPLFQDLAHYQAHLREHPCPTCQPFAGLRRSASSESIALATPPERPLLSIEAFPIVTPSS